MAGCPRCGSDDLRRIHRTMLMKILGITKYFRCRGCGHFFVSWFK